MSMTTTNSNRGRFSSSMMSWAWEQAGLTARRVFKEYRRLRQDGKDQHFAHYATNSRESPETELSLSLMVTSLRLPQVHPRPLPGRPEPVAQQRAPLPLPLAADVWERWHHHAPPPGSLPEVSTTARPPAEHHDPWKRRPPSAGWVRYCPCVSLKSETRFGWQGQTRCKTFSFEETLCSFRNYAIWKTHAKI